MRRVLFLLLLLCLYAASGMSGEDIPEHRYKASTIPPTLLQDVHAVVRHQEIDFEVTNIRRARERVHTLITVLDAEGRDFGEVYLMYDRFYRLTDLDARIFDAEGEEIRSLDGKDVKDYAAPSGGTLYEDNRVRFATMYHSVYPYTIEIEYEYTYDGYVSWPAWFPQETKASVEYSSLLVTAPKDVPVRYWSNVNSKPAITVAGSSTRYTWTSSMMHPYISEPVGPSETDQRQLVRLAPARFEIDGFEGDLSSWNSLGQWYKRLYSGRQILPEHERADLVALVKDATTPIEKTRRIYNRLQSSTRYVSVQLGVGGWQPFDAAYVCDRGYGDCKALSNYMVTMLNAVGVPAYPALIYNGLPRRSIDPDFPYRFSNHVIACVPFQTDTLWLECTSQTIPMGHIGASNESRYALLVAPDGGVLVRTPGSTAAENCQIRNASVMLSTSGGATAEIHTTFGGNQQDYARQGLGDATPKERETWMNDHIEIPVFNLQQMDFSRLDTKQSSYGFDVKLQLPRFASVAGRRLLFQPNLMEKRTYVPPPDTARKHPIVHSYAYLDIDTVVYTLPDGCEVEALPKPVAIETPFAKYASTVLITDPRHIRYTRRLEFSETELPAKTFNDYRKFLQDVVQADKASAALVRK